MYGHRSKGRRLSRRKSKGLFSKVARRTHKANLRSSSMRGGYRL